MATRLGARLRCLRLGLHHNAPCCRSYCDYEHSDNKQNYYKTFGKIPGVLIAGGLFGLFSSNKIDDLKKTIGNATMHLHQAEPHLAKPFLEAGLKLLDKELTRKRGDPVPAIELVYLMDQLGNIALQLESYREAVNLYTATIEGLVLHGIARNDRMNTELALKIAQIYAIMGENKLAELGFTHCVWVATAELKNTTGPKNPDTIALAGLAYEGLGKLYLSMGLCEQALQMYKHAIQFSDSVLGHDNPHFPVLLSDAAAVYESLGRYDKAMKMIHEAEIVAKKVTPFYCQRISIKRAYLLVLQNDLEGARQLYEDLIALCKERGDMETLSEIKANLKILAEKEKEAKKKEEETGNGEQENSSR